jgi:hypothetical protein
MQVFINFQPVVFNPGTAVVIQIIRWKIIERCEWFVEEKNGN